MKKKKIIIIITIIAFILVMTSIGSMVAYKQHSARVIKQAAKEEKVIKNTTIEVQKEEVVKNENSKTGEESFDYEYNDPKYIYNIYLFNNNGEKIETYGEIDYDYDKVVKILRQNGVTMRYDCNNTLMDVTITDTHKALIALNNLDVNSLETKKCSEAFSEYQLDKEHYANPTYIGKTGVCPITYSTHIIPYDKLNEEYQKLYNKPLPKENIDGSKINKINYNAFDYIPSKNIFAQTLTKRAGNCGYKYFIFLIKSVKEENNNMTIEMYYTKSISYKIEKTTEIINFKNFEITKISNWETNTYTDIYQEIRDKYIDKLDLYNIEFENNNGYYALKNIKKIKEA